MGNEVWKKISGYEGLYEVSSFGRVRSFPRNGTVGRVKICHPSDRGKRYLACPLYKNNKSTTTHVHRLVAQEFIENKENKKYVNHKNGVKTDNQVENLEWCTSKENALHAAKNGLTGGEKHYKAKLTVSQVKEIRDTYVSGKKSPTNQTILGKKYGVTKTLISEIIRRKCWKYI